MSEREHHAERKSNCQTRPSRTYEAPTIRSVKLESAVNTGATGNTDGLTRGTEVGDQG